MGRFRFIVACACASALRPRRALPAVGARKVGVPARGASRVARGGGSTFDVLDLMDLIGTGLFAFSGTIAAGREKMDLLGCAVVATVTCVGGGTLRDVLIGRTPVFWLRRVIYMKIALASSVATFMAWPRIEREWGGTDSNAAVTFADALGIGAFAVLGSDVATKAGCAPLTAIIFGMMSATFGGVMRDVLTRRPVRILHARVDGTSKTLYGSAALAGAALFVFLQTHFPAGDTDAQALAGFLATVIIRVYAYTFRVTLPEWMGYVGSKRDPIKQP